MQRIYFPNNQFLENITISEKETYHQLTRVMRARVGQMVVFFDGVSLEDYVYEISDINKDKVSFQKREVLEKKSEISPKLTLYQALPNKLGKLENIVQKCSEVGYSKIIFFDSERSQKLVLSDAKKNRLQKIAIEAIEQCWGNIMPNIEYRESRWEIFWDSIVCHPQGEDSLLLKDISISQSLNVLVGPEWWFSDDEVEGFQKLWVQKVFFWERVLRCETVWEVVGFFISQKKES